MEILPEISGKSSYELNIYNKDEYLEKDESFYLILYIKDEILTDGDYEIKISKREIDGTSNSFYCRFKLWLIILLSLLF